MTPHTMKCFCCSKTTPGVIISAKTLPSAFWNQYTNAWFFSLKDASLNINTPDHSQIYDRGSCNQLNYQTDPRETIWIAKDVYYKYFQSNSDWGEFSL